MALEKTFKEINWQEHLDYILACIDPVWVVLPGLILLGYHLYKKAEKEESNNNDGGNNNGGNNDEDTPVIALWKKRGKRDKSFAEKYTEELLKKRNERPK